MRLSRARARAERRAGSSKAAPNEAEKFGEKAPDLDAVRKAVEDAASVSAGLWLSYLFVLFYIGIAAGAVTHKDLLLENPVKLPFLNVELPLVAFFFLAPILFIVSHTYTLVHFVMLAAKVGVFDQELRAQLGSAPEAREGLRRQLPSNIFVQLLAGPGDIRNGGLGWLLKAVAWITLVIGPILLLLLIQVQFLPYHLEWVTWVQRFAILVNVILLWALWPAVLNGRSEIKWPRFWRHPVMTLASLAPVGLAFGVATFPGEWLDEYVGTGLPILAVCHDLLFSGRIDQVTLRRTSYFSNTLVLPNFDALEAARIDDPKKLDSIKHTLVLRGRHFEEAVFDHTDLRKGDLEGAHLQGARLISANLQGARLPDAQLQGALLIAARLDGAELIGAQLQGAWLKIAHLQGASLNLAQLQGAVVDHAQLQGASLIWSNLQGASLEFAQLQGASFEGAALQGVDFRASAFAGTNLGGAKLWRTNFEGVPLGAIFDDRLNEKEISRDEFAALKIGIMTEVPEGGRREALNRIEKLNPEIFGPEASVSDILEKGRADKAAYQRALADELKSLACSGDESAFYIMRGPAIRSSLGTLVIGSRFVPEGSRILEAGPFAPDLIESILVPGCPVSATLTGQDKADLRNLAKEAQARESKQ